MNKKEWRRRERSIPTIFWIEFASASRFFDHNRSSIVRNLRERAGAFPRMCMPWSWPEIYRVCACDEDQDHDPFQDDLAEDRGPWTGFAHGNTSGERVHASRGEMAERRERRKRKESERKTEKGRRGEEKTRRGPRGRSHPQSSKLAGERVIAFRDYGVEFVALFLLPFLPLVL